MYPPFSETPRQLSKVPQTERPVLADDVDPVPVNPFVATEGDNYLGGWSQSSAAPVNTFIASNRDANVGVWSQNSAAVQSSAGVSSFSDTSYPSEALPHTLFDTNVRHYTSEKMPHSPSHGSPASPVLLARHLELFQFARLFVCEREAVYVVINYTSHT